jgi:pyruvate kinase
MNVVRINCARDDAATWQRMAETARAAARDAGRELRVLMDLAGPKIRTTDPRPRAGIRVAAGDRIRLRRRDDVPTPEGAASCGCTLPEVLAAVAPGTAAAIDDGKLWAVVEAAGEFGLDLRVTRTKPGGMKLKPDRGLNFPGTSLPTSALTAADRDALATVVATADLVGYSFVQRSADIDDLVAAMAERTPEPHHLGVIAKIETDLAFRNLPEIVVRAAGRLPLGLMVARGDLGVEVGFTRLSEVQEEILWLAEAAHVPVVWATDVLASLVKNGMAARGEFTDAAMSARAECVMLNKGAFIAEGVRTLADVLRRAERHADKKTPQLAGLEAWYTPLT